MHRVVLVEDNDEQASALLWQIDRFPRRSECQVIRLSNAAMLKAYMESSGYPDILFIDIKLGDGQPDGIEAVRTLLPGARTQVIYVTGYIEYCTRVYRTNHMYFLTKPVDQRDLDDALNRAFDNLAASEKPLCVRVGGSAIMLPPSRITYVESDRRKLRIHTASETVETYATLSGVAAELPPQFVQCHKSFVVNMDSIARLEADEIQLVTGEVVPISQKRRKSVREAFFAHVALPA